MNFLKKLDMLMKERGLNMHTLSAQCGIPYNTILSWYKKGYGGIAVSKLIIIADFFDVELDYLMRDDEVDRYARRGIAKLPSDEEALLAYYRSCNDEGQYIIMASAKACAGNQSMQKNTPDKRSSQKPAI